MAALSSWRICCANSASPEGGLPKRFELSWNEELGRRSLQGKFRDLRNRHVLILDDILDTGATLKAIRRHIAAESGVLSIKVCVLLRKKLDVPKKADADYVGFDIPNEFVVVTGSTTTNGIAICPSSACHR